MEVLSAKLLCNGCMQTYIAGKILFLSVYVRLFMKGVSIWTDGLNKEDIPSMMWVSIVMSIKVTGKQKRRTRESL